MLPRHLLSCDALKPSAEIQKKYRTSPGAPTLAPKSASLAARTVTRSRRASAPARIARGGVQHYERVQRVRLDYVTRLYAELGYPKAEPRRRAIAVYSAFAAVRRSSSLENSA